MASINTISKMSKSDRVARAAELRATVDGIHGACQCGSMGEAADYIRESAELPRWMRRVVSHLFYLPADRLYDAAVRELESEARRYEDA